MKPFNDRLTGWTVIAAGICTLGITFSLAAVNVIGGIGDVLGVVAAVLIIPVLIAIGRIVMAKHQTLGLLIQILGVLGALTDAIQLILFISGVIAYKQSEAWSSITRGLIGISVLTYALVNRKSPEPKRLYIWLSIILGVIMAQSFVSLILQGEIDAIMQGSVSGSNPILLAYIVVFAPIFLLGWPIWLIWTGRLFLKGKLAVPESIEPAPRNT